MERFSRISRNIEVMGGKACIKGTRVTVGILVAMIGDGKTEAEILSDYPYLKDGDIKQALRYAALSVEGKETEIALA
jgi:uncharacterized protein (DUF433 family)